MEHLLLDQILSIDLFLVQLSDLVFIVFFTVEGVETFVQFVLACEDSSEVRTSCWKKSGHFLAVLS